jgi:oligoendopeptidase F
MSETTLRARERGEIPSADTWNLADIYPDTAAWKEARAALMPLLEKITAFRGRLGTSPAELLACLRLLDTLGKEFARLHGYASMLSDQDTRIAEAQAMEAEMSQLGSEIGSRTSFVDPELLAIGGEKIGEFLSVEPALGLYRHALEDTLRRREHTGTESEERIIAAAGLVADGPGSIYSLFSDADFPYPEVTLTNSRTVRLDKAAFALHKAEPDREDRRKVFAAYFGSLNGYRRTFGAQLAAEVKKNVFFARARKYPSALARALDGGNIPEAVYRGLIQGVHAHLPVFHRYLNLRRRLLGVERLHYHDLYAPLVPEADRRYAYDEACALVLDSLAPLGAEYVDVVRKSFAERWIDVYPNTGKRSGAYSNGAAYDVHPYILLNYNGKYDDVSTLTHELGHTMHSWLTNRAQAYVNSHYSIFVAEVASTFNEALLLDHMLKVVEDPRVRLSLLGSYLDGVRGTVFRQTQFAEFELAMHEMVERGEAITGDALHALYHDMTKQYYGHDAGVCVVDEEIAAEWAHIPHFYYNFYVYQYATSFTASSALAEQVLAGDRDAGKRYLELLKSGGSDYPIQLLKRAGVDMTTSGPMDLLMKRVERVVVQMEEEAGG